MRKLLTIVAVPAVLTCLLVIGNRSGEAARPNAAQASVPTIEAESLPGFQILNHSPERAL
jgi:hypothetical protein